MHKLTIIFMVIVSLTFTSTAFAATPTQEPPINSVKHVVKANETLSHIASFYQVTVQNIVSLNNLANPNKLQIGQTLLIPKKDVNLANVPTTSNNPSPTPNETQMEKYVIKAKDTFSSIARIHGISSEAIITANQTINPNSLQIGQVINLPVSTQNLSLASRSDDERTRESTEAEAEASEQVEKGPTDDLAVKVIDYAKTFLGCAYSYGADGPKSFDCSGFTMFVFKHFDIDLPHNSASQANKGSKVKRSDLIRGDLVFFKTSNNGISHVGLYIGNGDFIHASTGERKIEITSLSETYYNTRYVTARRILE